jgi:hypothetical protein
MRPNIFLLSLFLFATLLAHANEPVRFTATAPSTVVWKNLFSWFIR